MRRLRDEESGFSLIELIIAVVVLGIGVVAIVAAMGTSIIGADVHRSLAGGETVARDYIDAVKAKALTLPDYVQCPAAADLKPTFPSASNPAWQDDYDAAIVVVEYWLPNPDDPLTGSFTLPEDDPVAAQAECRNVASARCTDALTDPDTDELPSFCDPGMQRVTVEVTTKNESGASDTEQIARVILRRGDG